MRSGGRAQVAIAAMLTMVLLLSTAGSAAAAPPSMSATTIASGLSIPWDVAFLPDGRMLVTERVGRVRIYSSGAAGASLVQTVGIAGVRAEGEAGLMGIAVDVDFAANRYVYVCASRQYTGSGGWVNQVLRYTINASDVWVGPTVILTGMVANTIHNGCAVEMDRFGRLWVSMGDAAVGSRAQNRGSLNGKILRINRDGGIPGDNPVISGSRNQVYSMGHRNPQGIAIRPGTDQVYAAEHGPDVNDEINLIVPGGNYGWPCYTGFGTPESPSVCGGAPASNYRNPLWASGGATIATSGAAFASGPQWADYNGQLFVSTLKQSDVRRFSINAAGTALGGPATHFDNAWGRLRAMVYGPGGQLYVTTSNGSNDRVIRIRTAQPSTSRAAGSDRYATAAALSATYFPSGAGSVFVATGANYPDALAGGAAAGRLNLPVLLVRPTDIPGSTATELNRLDPDQIFVLGGTGAISESIRTQLQAYANTGNVVRVAGADRYATAVEVSKRWYAPGVPAVFIATGTGFADALAGAPAAAMSEAPLLLVRPSEIPAVTSAELQRLAPERIYVLGGTGAVSASVATQLDAYTTGPVTRLSGSDRYATAAAVARQFWGRTPRAFVANGTGFADALAGGAVAGRDNSPMLLVPGTWVPLTTGQEIIRMAPFRLQLLGGVGAISNAAELRLRALIATP
ncbi:MAG TPA: PQQ-dependent sugar dehydrogenase [Candidatus Limnocylindria bacterium]|nr:PQQ-dependent sugar dehydrogenase [Candidatus Limnocylindria bacterium]